MVLAFVLQILFQNYYLYIPNLHCNGILRLCFNDSFFFLEPIVVSQKERKKGKRGGGGGGGGGGGEGEANVRSLRLKNWLPLESIIIYKVVRL